MSVSGVIAEFAAWADPAIAGWRYLISPSYRARKHLDWKQEHIGYVGLDILGGIIGVGITVAVAIIVVLLALRAIST